MVDKKFSIFAYDCKKRKRKIKNRGKIRYLFKNEKDRHLVNRSFPTRHRIFLLKFNFNKLLNLIH